MKVENTYVDGYDKLPEKAYIAVKKGTKILLIQKGNSNYKEVETMETADQLNQQIGVSKAEAKAMWHGCCGLGWHYNYNADPDFYDQNGEIDVIKVKDLILRNMKSFSLSSMIFELINQYDVSLFEKIGVTLTDDVECAKTKICKYLNNDISVLYQLIDQIRQNMNPGIEDDILEIQEMLDEYNITGYE